MVALKDDNDTLHTLPKKVGEIHTEALTKTISKDPREVFRFKEIEKNVKDDSTSEVRGSKESADFPGSQPRGQGSENRKDCQGTQTGHQTIQKFEMDEFRILKQDWGLQVFLGLSFIPNDCNPYAYYKTFS